MTTANEGEDDDDVSHDTLLTLADTGTITPVLVVYVVAAVLVITLYVALFGMQSLFVEERLLSCGLLLTLGILAVNAWRAPHQFEGGYDHDIIELDTVARNSFYLAAVLFALGSFTHILKREDMQYIFPLVLLTIACLGALILPTFFVHSSTTKSVVIIKHSKGAVSGIASGFVLAAALVLFKRTALSGKTIVRV